MPPAHACTSHGRDAWKTREIAEFRPGFDRHRNAALRGSLVPAKQGLRLRGGGGFLGSLHWSCGGKPARTGLLQPRRRVACTVLKY